MINKYNTENYKRMLDGLYIKTTVMGKETIMTEFKMKKGSKLASHNHGDFEQTGFLVSGRIILTINGIEHEMTAGDSWCIEKSVEHKAVVLEDAVAIEVFSYPREDYVPLLDPASI